jgi:hypothetical protein
MGEETEIELNQCSFVFSIRERVFKHLPSNEELAQIFAGGRLYN